MPRERKIGLRRHKATGVHYTTLPDGKFKYFSRNPEVAESEYAAWLNTRHLAADSQGSSSIAPPGTAVNTRLTTVRDVFNAYLGFLKRNRGQWHYIHTKKALQQFCDECAPAGTPLQNLQKAQFVAWRERLHGIVKADKKSAFWANKRTRAVKAAFRRGLKDCELVVSKAHLDELLFTLYQVPEPMPDDTPFTPKEVTKLLQQASPQVQAMILLALNGCFDNVDVSRIQWSNIDLAEKVINYPRQKPGWKTTRPRRFRLWDRTATALDAMAPRQQRTGRIFSTKYGREWVRPGRDSLAQEFAKIKKAAGVVTDGGFRNLRKSAITAAAVAGVGEVTIEMLLGHASPKMWRRYAGVVPPAAEEAIAKIEAHFFGAPSAPRPDEVKNDGAVATAQDS